MAACQKIENAIERRGTCLFTQQSRKNRPPRNSFGARGPESKARKLSLIRLPRVCHGTLSRGSGGATVRGFCVSGKIEMNLTGMCVDYTCPKRLRTADVRIVRVRELGCFDWMQPTRRRRLAGTQVFCQHEAGALDIYARLPFIIRMRNEFWRENLGFACAAMGVDYQRHRCASTFDRIDRATLY